jgi:hypothetical protein
MASGGDKMRELKALHDAELITAEEYTAKRRQLLEGMYLMRTPWVRPHGREEHSGDRGLSTMPAHRGSDVIGYARPMPGMVWPDSERPRKDLGHNLDVG